MIEEQLQAEWQYRYEERMGIILSDLANPTAMQQQYARDLARHEADQWLADWRNAQMLL